MENEIWKPILDFNGLYEVSNLGSVKSLVTNKILALCINGRGYYHVELCKDGKHYTKRVHRLVWEAFNGKTDLQVHHIYQFNKLDNRLCNLTTGACRKNLTDWHNEKNTSSKYIGVNWDKLNKKWVSKIYFNKKRIFLGYHKDELEAAKSYQIALNTIKIYGTV